MESPHRPVLLAECLELLGLSGDGSGSLMLDCTLGEGGHSIAFLERYPGLRLLAMDADAQAMERAKLRLAGYADRIEFARGYFDELLHDRDWGAGRPAIILMDLGISMFHYELSGRGFSFQRDEALDMRIDPSRGDPAAKLVNGLGEEALAALLFELADERYSRRIAKAIVAERSRSAIRGSLELAELVRRAVPPEARRTRNHPATKTFQALRMAVNDERGRLERGLALAMEALAPGGVLGVISFHSAEDGIVKRQFRQAVKSCTCPPEAPICECGGVAAFTPVTRKPAQCGPEERRENPPSRSAKLRVVRKLGEAR